MDIEYGRGVTTMALRNFFRNFRKTAARQRAAAAVRRAERNAMARIGRWERRRGDGVKAQDPRRDYSEMNTNQLKAYARELNRVRGNNIKAAGIVAKSGELLDMGQWEEYSRLWEARETEKKTALASLKLKGVPTMTTPLTLLDIDPETGQLRQSYGGNYVLQQYGPVQIPESKATMERRITQMRKWQSIESRMTTSEGNVSKILNVIDGGLVDAWNGLNRAQKQYLINVEKVFDLVHLFTITTDPKEVARFRLLDEERFQGTLEQLYAMIGAAGELEGA